MYMPLAAPKGLSKPLKLTLSINEVCNLDCAHCYSDCYSDCVGAARPEQMNTEQLLNLVNELIELNIIHLFIEGGEPLLRPDLFQVLQACTPYMMTWLRSNATLIDQRVADELKKIGVGTLCVDVLGASQATHEALTQQSSSFEQTLSGIRYSLAAGLPVVMLIILNRKNHQELQSYLTLAQSLGVTSVGILRLYPLGRAKQRWSELALSLEEMHAALDNLEVPEGLRVMRSWHPRDGNCCWQNAAINARGDSIGCPYLRDYVNYGNVQNMSFMETWDHPLYQLLRSDRTERACTDCASSQGSRGGCRSTAYAFHGRWTAPDPFCIKMNNGVDLRVLP